MISLDEASIILAHDCEVLLSEPPRERDLTLIHLWWRDKEGYQYNYPWHIMEDRCRPMLVDHYGITTEKIMNGNWASFQSVYNKDCISNKVTHSRTSRGSQIDCLRRLAEVIKQRNESGKAHTQ